MSKTRVVTFRLAEEVYLALESKAQEQELKLGEYLRNVIESLTGYAPVIYRPPVIDRSLRHAQPEDFATLLAEAEKTVGAPLVCPVCATDDLTRSRTGEMGGYWSCHRCRARGRWAYSLPPVVEKQGLPREKWSA